MPTNTLIWWPLVFYPDESLGRKVPLALSRRSHHISPSSINATHILSHDGQQLADFTVNYSCWFCCVVSVVSETTQQHLDPSPAPGTVKPSNCIYMKMKAPICEGSERVYWVAKSSRQCKHADHAGKKAGIRRTYLTMSKKLRGNTSVIEPISYYWLLSHMGGICKRSNPSSEWCSFQQWLFRQRKYSEATETDALYNWRACVMEYKESETGFPWRYQVIIHKWLFKSSIKHYFYTLLLFSFCYLMQG